MPDVVDDPVPMAPILEGGQTDELLNSWAWWYSLATKAVAAGQTVYLPGTPAPEELPPEPDPEPEPPEVPIEPELVMAPGVPDLLLGVAVPPITGIALLEGPGGAYSVIRNNNVSYVQSQQQTVVVAAKPNPWQY